MVEFLTDINRKVREKNDYRDLLTVSVDPQDATELDDSISLEKTTNGYRLGIHIADVAAQLPLGHPYDKRARRAATSLYVPIYVPMFPHHFTRQLSLDKGMDRLARSVFFEINRDGKIAKKEFVPTTVCLDENLSYENFKYEVKMPKMRPLFKDLFQLMNLLSCQGGYCPSGFFYEGENGQSGKLMVFYAVLANSQTAQYLLECGVPTTRRSFYKPNGSIPELNIFARKLVDNQMAFYTMGNHPHQCLGLDHYMHSTSPIRRYADIMAQRQLQALDDEKICYLTRRFLKQTAEQINETLCERKISKAA